MNPQVRNVIFVDDDPMVIHGLHRSALGFGDHWNIFFANSGQEALNRLAVTPMDVLVTDMRMPGMDGIELLEKVSQQHPEVIRIILSGNSEYSRMLQSTRLAHQFLAKPCDFEKLHHILEQSCRVRDLLKEPRLVRLTTGVVQLPSMPRLYSRLLKELQSEEPSPKLIGDIIAQDVSMTAKILQLVNSAFFSLPGNVSSAQRAVSILGINTIKALVLGIQIFSEFERYSSQNFSIDALWKHSLLVGQLTRKLARQAGLDAHIQEDSQAAGVLHDIGKLLEVRIPGFLQNCKYDHGRFTLESEYQLLGTTHAQVGAYLLGIWGLPEHIVDVVALHHQPLGAKEGFTLASALYIANGLDYLYTIHKPVELSLALDLNYIEQLGVTNQMPEWVNLCRELNEATQ